MIHTFTLSHDLTTNRALYNHLRESIYGLGRLPTGSSVCSKAFYARGLREITLQSVVKRDVQYHAIDIRINPAVILDQRETFRLITDQDIPPIESRFNSLIADICNTNDLPAMTDWKVNRLDYAIDITTENVPKYVDLFKRGDHPKKCTIDDRGGSLYIKCATYTISFYDKQAQLRYNGEESAEASNILRLEVQFENDKARYIQKKQKFDSRQLRHFLSPELARNHILYYWDKTVGTGDYYTLNRAAAIIDQSSHTPDMKRKLVEALQAIENAGSIFEAREQANNCKKTFNEHLKRLRALNINPVTIPRNMRCNHLESLRSHIR